MFKVLLVDDEPWILAGLQASIDWTAEGFEICATASNGIEAERLAMERRPDLVLADIRMPSCDGLTLLKRLRQSGCTALFAIISGYAEFAYAQESIRLGACGYLLKPIEEAELLSLIHSVRQLLQKRYERMLFDELEQETGLIASLFPHGCWITALYGDVEPAQAQSALSCRLSRRSRLYLSEMPLIRREEELPDGCFAGICRHIPGRESFAAEAAACREASWQGFVTHKKRLFQPSDLPVNEPMTAAPAKQLQFYQEHLSHTTVRQLYALYLSLQGCSESIPPDTPEWLLEHFEHAEQLLAHMEAGLHAQEEADSEDISIVAYLKEHFHEDLSLETVSRELSMSVSSVRRMLQRENGESFQHCLATLRIERACTLLRESDLSINEVAYSSGFRDALYFRRAFKKCVGLTPSEYRTRGNAC